MTPKRAAIYIRVSSEEQARYGYSLATQLQACRHYAEVNGFIIAAELTDDVSGRIPIADRPGGKQLYNLIDTRQINAVLLYTNDRTARDKFSLEYLQIKSHLYDHGLELNYSDSGIDADTMEANIIGYIKSQAAAEESRKIGDRSSRNRKAKAQSGKWVGGTPPFGYRRVGRARDTRMVIYEPEADIVRSIYRWYVTDRLAMMAIADRLNSTGVKTQRGVLWWKAIIKKILSNETYIGIVYYAGIRIDLPELAIIDPATFERAQELKQLNRERATRNRKHEYLLSNHLRCMCGETMPGSTTPDAYQRVYYRCSQFQWPATRRNCPLGAPHASGFVLDGIVWSYVAELIDDDDLLTACIAELNAARQSGDLDGAAEIERCDKAIASAQRRIDRLLREFGDDADEDVTRATRAAIRDAQRERDEARVRREMLLSEQREMEHAEAGQDSVLEQVRNWRGLIGQADFEFRRDVLDALDVRVTLRADDAGRRAVEVGTALSLPRRFEYVNARAYQKRLWGEKP